MRVTIISQMFIIYFHEPQMVGLSFVLSAFLIFTDTALVRLFPLGLSHHVLAVAYSSPPQ